MRYSSIFIFSLLFLSATNAFATPSPEALEILESSESSITLDWEDVENAEGYYIYYGTQTGSGASYEVEGIDLIDESEFILDGLSADTDYYIAVTALDEFGKESEYSREVSYKTQSLGQGSVNTTDFRIIDVEVIDEGTIELKFSTDLEMSSDASRVFIVEDKQMGTEIPVDISQVSESDNKNVLVLLGVDMIENTEYKVTVLEIRDTKGNTIESGIDAFISYTTGPSFGDTQLNSAPEDVDNDIDEKQEVVQDPVSAENEDDLPDDQNEQVENTKEDSKEIVITPLQSSSSKESGGNVGVTVSQDDLDSNGVTIAANSTDKLPKTGPEMWLLFGLIALFAGAMLLIVNNKKDA